jgi:hypothetical protein
VIAERETFDATGGPARAVAVPVVVRLLAGDDLGDVAAFVADTGAQLAEGLACPYPDGPAFDGIR